MKNHLMRLVKTKNPKCVATAKAGSLTSIVWIGVITFLDQGIGNLLAIPAAILFYGLPLALLLSAFSYVIGIPIHLKKS
jgi:hypothetical protein